MSTINTFHLFPMDRTLRAEGVVSGFGISVQYAQFGNILSRKGGNPGHLVSLWFRNKENARKYMAKNHPDLSERA